jgi:benzoyl-CoA reductase/2-hydroxyglutaryl-CoA dehydratase subunit BcrC/BadD/HgdB
MRDLLRKISFLRQNSASPVSSLDFVKLNHASYYADPVFMVDALNSTYQELLSKGPAAAAGSPRILLIGPNLGIGDYTILELIKAAGGEVVIEEICEGLRYYWKDLSTEGDLWQSLARGYLIDRIPCAFMRRSTQERFDFTLKLIKDFKIDGVVWYQLVCCETYDSESYYFSHKLGDLKVPMLLLESDFSTSTTGQIKTRIEAFTEIVKGEI